MQFLRFCLNGDHSSAARLGARTGLSIADLTGAGLPGTVEEMLACRDWRARAEQALEDATTHDPEAVRVLAPLARPSKILCLGMNFHTHAAEVGVEEQVEPTVFSKLPSAITGPTDPIMLPARAPARVDYEAELAVVIGRRGREIPVAEAMEWVAGYTVANDVSARDWQLKKPAGQWLLGKSFDTFLPLGPVLVTPDEAPAPAAMTLRCVVNGETLQDAGVADLVVGIAETIAYLSQVCTLEPGDLLLTGTPEGVGMARTPRRFLAAGDVVETSVTGVGTLCNPVTASVTDNAQVPRR